MASEAVFNIMFLMMNFGDFSPIWAVDKVEEWKLLAVCGDFCSVLVQPILGILSLIYSSENKNHLLLTCGVRIKLISFLIFWLKFLRFNF